VNRLRTHAAASTTRLLSALLLAAMVLAACGGAPTAEEGASGDDGTAAPGGEPTAEAGGGSEAPSGAMSLEDVYAEVEGLTGEERRAALIELATGECDEPVDLYTSINVEITQSMIDQFIEDTGVPAELYRAANEDLNRRILEEEDADVADVADVIANNDLEQEILDREGILAPLDTPATEGNSVVTETWAGSDRLVYMAAWGESLESPPTTWEEVFNAEALAFQLGDVNWFATLVNDYYVAEQGMTEREAVDMIVEAVAGSQIVNGHTLGAQLLASGEYRVASSLYLYRVRSLIEEGAPIAWEPAVEPLIARVTGLGMHKRTPCPASALLLTEYMLTDFQEMLPEFGRLPALENVEGGVPEEYDVLPINREIVLDDFDKWQGYYDEVTGAIGGEVLSE